MLGKRRVPPLLENLQNGLLDQSVDDARHAELKAPEVVREIGVYDVRVTPEQQLLQLYAACWAFRPGR